MSKPIIISTKPRFAKKIYSGEKTIEIRRVTPNNRNYKALIYETSPVQEITGMFTIEFSSQQFIYEHSKKTAIEKGCVTEKEFKDYIEGADLFYFLWIGETRKAEKSLGLPEIRETITSFYPPQNFRYVEEAKYQELLNRMGVPDVTEEEFLDNL